VITEHNKKFCDLGNSILLFEDGGGKMRPTFLDGLSKNAKWKPQKDIRITQRSILGRHLC
jgi:hypothetical protein